jgi:hypothetical protein
MCFLCGSDTLVFNLRGHLAIARSARAGPSPGSRPVLRDMSRQSTVALHDCTFCRVGHFGLPVHFVARLELHGRFKCCPDSHRISAILSTCLAMFCTPATFTASAFPSYSPCHFLCTSHLSSLAFLSHLPFPSQIFVCFPDCVVPILAHLLPWHGV